MKKIDTVLFVDDEENILNSLRRGLIDEKYRCLFASSGYQALEILKKEHVSVIVSDMKMPGMDGLKLLKEVKKNYPKTVRMVLSGYAQLQQVITTVNTADIYKFILKPWKYDDGFREGIHQAIEYHRLQVEREEIESALKKKNLAYQKIFNHLQEVIDNGKKNAKMYETIGLKAFELIEEDIYFNYDPEIMKGKIQTASQVFNAVSLIDLSEATDKSVNDFIKELKLLTKGIKNVNNYNISFENNGIYSFRTNYKLIYYLIEIMLKIIGKESQENIVNISVQYDQVEEKYILNIIIINTISDNLNSNKLDISLNIFNVLIDKIIKCQDGYFKCIRKEENIIIKFTLN